MPDPPGFPSGRVPAWPRSRAPALVVALDVPTLAEAVDLVEALRGLVSWFKVGSELFTSAGPPAVRAVLDRGGRVFLDLKFHDIPRTVAAAVGAAADLGVSMMTVHVAAGEEALTRASQILRARPQPPPPVPDRASARARAAIADPPPPSPEPRSRLPVPRTPSPKPRPSSGPRTPAPGHRPLLIGVTRLTSHPSAPAALQEVVEAAQAARRCGLDGVVVAAASETPAVRRACTDAFVIVTPGIRPAGTPGGDQARTATPAEAVRAGADYLVVGRPIVAAADPRQAAARILEEMEAAARQDPPAPSRKQ